MRLERHLLPGRGLVVVRIDRDLSRVRVDVLGFRRVRPQIPVEAVVLAPHAGAGELIAPGRRRAGWRLIQRAC